jgi:hypothetical protein
VNALAHSPRHQLDALAAKRGYSTSSLALLTQALFPRHQAGAQLSDAQVEELAGALDVWERSGASERHVAALIGQHRHASGRADWRAGLWRERLALATVNYRTEATTASAETHARIAPVAAPPSAPSQAPIATAMVIPPQPPSQTRRSDGTSRSAA